MKSAAALTNAFSLFMQFVVVTRRWGGGVHETHDDRPTNNNNNKQNLRAPLTFCPTFCSKCIPVPHAVALPDLMIPRVVLSSFTPTAMKASMPSISLTNMVAMSSSFTFATTPRLPSSSSLPLLSTLYVVAASIAGVASRTRNATSGAPPPGADEPPSSSSLAPADMGRGNNGAAASSNADAASSSSTTNSACSVSNDP